MRRELTVGSLLAACGFVLHAATAFAADPAASDLPPHTAESGAELTPVARAMDLPQLALAGA